MVTGTGLFMFLAIHHVEGPSKHVEPLWINVGPASQAVSQRWVNVSYLLFCLYDQFNSLKAESFCFAEQ